MIRKQGDTKSNDYRREGRTYPIKVTIIDERGEDSASNVAQSGTFGPHSDPPEPTSTERWDRAPPTYRFCARFQTVSNGMPTYERRAYGGKGGLAPNPWTPKPKREPSSESFREKDEDATIEKVRF